MGAKARKIDGYKLWNSGHAIARNAVSILVDKELANQVVEMRCKSDCIISIKLVVGAKILNIYVSMHHKWGQWKTPRGNFERSWKKSFQVYLKVSS